MHAQVHAAVPIGGSGGGDGSSSSTIPKGLLVDGSSLSLGILLGEGGFARVYEARIDLGKHFGGEHSVAFKRLNDGVKSLGADALAAELKMQSQVDAHPNIVKVRLHQSGILVLVAPRERPCIVLV